jgi:hypothetical protein
MRRPFRMQRSRRGVVTVVAGAAVVVAAAALVTSAMPSMRRYLRMRRM